MLRRPPTTISRPPTPRAASPSARRAPPAARAARGACREVERVAGLEAREMPNSDGYAASIPSATSSRPEWRATSGGQPAAAASAATIPNASGKIEGTTHDVGERNQVHEVPVLERAGEERPRRRDPLELAPVVAEPDDDDARVHPAHRLEQHVDALVVEELPEVEDVGASPGRTRRSARRCPRREAAPGVARVGRVGACLLEQRRRAPRRAAQGTNSSTSTPGGTSCTWSI